MDALAGQTAATQNTAKQNTAKQNTAKQNTTRQNAAQENTVHWVPRRPSAAGVSPQQTTMPRATAQLRWRTSNVAPPKLLSKPPASERLAPDNVLRQAAEPEVYEQSESPIRLTANSEPRDPFAAPDEVAEDEMPSDEALADDAPASAVMPPSDALDESPPDDSLLTAEVNDDLEVGEPANSPAAIDEELTEQPTRNYVDSDLAENDDELADDPRDRPAMVDLDANDDLPQFVQRSMDDASEGEPLPAEVQDERFPARLPEPGDDSADDGRQPERCPSPRDLKPINQITHRIAADPGLFPQECVLSDEPFQPRNFSCTVFTWKASALCHKPLYFQQAKLERYGHTFGPVLTPVLSTGHFFVSVLALPYKIGMNPPWECMYPLGWYRPGSCAPYTLGPVPISLRGAALQGLVTTGLWFLFP